MAPKGQGLQIHQKQLMMVMKTMSDAKILGQILRDQRVKRKFSQEKLSELTGLSVQSISNAERGVHAPNFSSVIKILRAVGLPIQDLITHIQELGGPDQKEEIIDEISLMLSNLNIKGLLIVRDHCKVMLSYFRSE